MNGDFYEQAQMIPISDLENGVGTPQPAGVP